MVVVVVVMVVVVVVVVIVVVAVAAAAAVAVERPYLVAVVGCKGGRRAIGRRGASAGGCLCVCVLWCVWVNGGGWV